MSIGVLRSPIAQGPPRSCNILFPEAAFHSPSGVCCQSKHRLAMSSNDNDSSSCGLSRHPVDRVEVWRAFSDGLATPYAFEGESRLVSRLVIFTQPCEYGRFIVASRGVLHLQRLVFYHHALVARGEPGLFVHYA